MHYRTMDEVAGLVEGFKAQTLLQSEWDHAAHLTVCCWYLMRHPERSESLLRAGIRRYNRTLGILTTSTSGYHETLTLFWITKVRALLEVCEGPDLAVINAVVHALADKELVLFHYSAEQIMSKEARRQWCEPDLRPLPGHLHRRAEGLRPAVRSA